MCGNYSPPTSLGPGGSQVIDRRGYAVGAPVRASICICLICLLALPAAAHANSAQEKGYGRALLGLPLSPAPIMRRGITISRALRLVGFQLRDGYALFGVELRLSGGREPTVNLNLQPGSNLGDALGQILGQLPGYASEVVSLHLVNIYPTGARDDPGDLLNLRVTSFDGVMELPTDILSRPYDFIPALKARLKLPTEGYTGRGLITIAPRVTLHLTNATVREILNAVSEAAEQSIPKVFPPGWLCTIRAGPGSPTRGIYSWRPLFSWPESWRKEGASTAALARRRPLPGVRRPRGEGSGCLRGMIGACPRGEIRSSPAPATGQAARTPCPLSRILAAPPEYVVATLGSSGIASLSLRPTTVTSYPPIRAIAAAARPLRRRR